MIIAPPFYRGLYGIYYQEPNGTISKVAEVCIFSDGSACVRYAGEPSELPQAFYQDAYDAMAKFSSGDHYMEKTE